MNNNTSVEAQQAWEMIHHLASEIGPRPAGSSAVQETFSFLQEKLENGGWRCERQPFLFAAYPKFSPYYSIAALFFVLSAWGLLSLPLVVIPLPFVVAALPEVWQLLQRRRRRDQPAQNLFALPQNAALDNLDLILCAHVDTARQNPVSSKIGRSLQTNIFMLMQRLAWMVVFFALFFWVGFRVPFEVLNAVGILMVVFAVFLVGMDLWEQLTHQNRFVPGAVDNASGVAILMILAQYLQQNPRGDLKVGFLFTDAEEPGMFGAEAFALRMQQAGLKTPVVVLDQVGAGKVIRIVRGVGRFKLYKTDARLADLFYRLAPDARDLFYIYRNGDFSSFLRAGIPAISIETSGSDRAKWAYHRMEDTIRVVQKETLDRVIRMMIKLMAIYKHEQFDK